ncbi:J domain-containing protein [Croceicoccus ponticola]|uniref:J domain-containing protein n=1 Tax=Croceicoccus ponticola TaxID=2217664 RepID=A0A437GW02_9SPHN|nr:J domain-containing protein [Croceicoccus ponticola]RVQ66079.1 J domain-containing protein [Croceicoccus ponticola]
MRYDRFHGRFENEGRCCEAPGCEEGGDFRAPGSRGPSFDGPGDWRWFCLEHVRAFNAGYDFFKGMSADEILDAQSPIAGWRHNARVYSGMGNDAPRWADFDDPLDAISARARNIRGDREQQWEQEAYARQRGLDAADRRALEELGLSFDADRPMLRRRYSELVRRYHPDRNGGDRSHEDRLQRVVAAYQHLCKAQRFT